MILAMLAIGFGLILGLAAIASFATKKRGKGFYSEGTSDGPWSVSERLTRQRTQDDTFNRKYR